MKKYLFPLIAGLGLAVSARGAVVLDETFTYADGALTNVSTIWTNHSGTLAQMDVTGGKVNLSQAEAEDMNALLTGAPYTSGNLYASFVVNFTTLPTGGGAYFAHFKDTSTGFRCRVYANTTGAGAGKFRLGVGNAGTAFVNAVKDLDLNTDYTVVIRYNTGTTPASTLWINPGSEASVADRADATDVQPQVTGGMTSFGLRQSGSMGILTLDNLKVGTAFADVVVGGDPTLNPPFISSIANQSIPRNGVTPAVPFYVTDGETAHGSLAVAPTVSSNPTLVPLGNISISGNVDSNRTVTVTPATGEQGFSEITATVTDEHNNTAGRNFLVIVGAPTISSFTNTTTPKDTATPAIAFTVGDEESDALTITGSSSNLAVVPISGITFDGAGANRSVTITPAAGAYGLTRITVFVSDGFNTVSNSFLLNVYSNFGLVLADSFSYPDGSLVSSSPIWANHSGTNGDAQILGGKLLLSSSRSEDVSSFFTNPPSFVTVPFPQHEGWILYSHFTVNFNSRPTAGSGEYFAHFRSTGISFGARVFGTTNGAGAGKVRLGIANSAAAPSVVLPADLDTNRTYSVVTRYNVGTGQSTLWVNPKSESDAGVTATDSAFPFQVETYAFRQNAGIGNLAVDDIKVATSFLDVVGPALTITAVGNNVTLSWPAAATGYILRYTDEFPAVGSPVGADYPDQGTVQGNLKVVTINGVTGNRFFQLEKP